MRSEHSTGREYGARYSWTPFPVYPRATRPPGSVFMASDHPEMKRLSEAFRQRGGRSHFFMWKGYRPGVPGPCFSIRSRLIGNHVADSPEATLAAAHKAVASWVDPFAELIELVRPRRRNAVDA